MVVRQMGAQLRKALHARRIVGRTFRERNFFDLSPEKRRAPRGSENGSHRKLFRPAAFKYSGNE